MRAVALALVLAVAPIGPTLCEVRCADASASHTPAGVPATATHDMQAMSAEGVHDMAAMAIGQEHQGEEPGTDAVVASSSACSHSSSVVPSILRAGDEASLLVVATAHSPSAFLLHVQAAVTFGVLTSPSASPPLHVALPVPLRI